MAGEEIQRQVLEILQDDNRLERLSAMSDLRDSSQLEAFDAVLSALDSSSEKIRRRAGSALVLFGRLVGARADFLIARLRHAADPSVRLSCAIMLMSARSAGVRTAYRDALSDSFVKVAQIACIETGRFPGKAATAALKSTLNRPEWEVRLEACKALIIQGTADDRVVAVLEALSKEPQAASYDAQIEELDRLELEYRQQSGDESPPLETWGKLSSIIERAREAARESAA